MTRLQLHNRLQMSQYWGAVNNNANQFLYVTAMNRGGSNTMETSWA